MTSRVYIDFTNDSQFDVSFEQLLREIHGAPLHPKPPLGENPFSKQSPEVEVSSHSLPEIPEKVESAFDAYKTAEAFIRVDERFGWQQFVKQIRRDTSNALQKLRPELEQQKTRKQGRTV